MMPHLFEEGGENVNKRDQVRFKKLLNERKLALMNAMDDTKEQGLGFTQEDLPDEIDLATSEADQSMNLRLRDRERVLLKKIDRTLEKIAEGEFGVCESCGEDISVKRLEARPVTDLCIRCKEEQERVEKGFAD